MIDDRYADAFGNPVVVSEATMAAMREALGERSSDALQWSTTARSRGDPGIRGVLSDSFAWRLRG